MNKTFNFNLVTLTMAVLAGLVAMSSCTKNPLSPGVEYMPDMYRSPSYETYSVNAMFSDSLSARQPVAGTITQGEWPHQGSLINALPYHRVNTIEEYAAAAADKSPLDSSAAHAEQGKVIFEKMCIHCHGVAGAGDGTLIATGKFPPPPAYNSTLKSLEEGKMFFSITYGKNLMGAHASQLTKEERWKVIRYVQQLQNI
ncbi:MAG: cytochrome c [Flavobacteriales bacterium]|nr:cytochrome c [Flavobacteriales bacterium]